VRTSTLFTIEGVLTKEGVGGVPMLHGKMLLAGLLPQSQVFFLTEEPDRQLVLDWIHTELAIVQPKVLGPDIEDPIRTVRHLGYDVSFFVSPSPPQCARAMDQGVTALVYAAPAYQRPEFRPDFRGPVKEWDAVQAEMDRQRSINAEDPRRKTDFEDGRFGH
jgi:hypothetical protein